MIYARLLSAWRPANTHRYRERIRASDNARDTCSVDSSRSRYALFAGKNTAALAVCLCASECRSAFPSLFVWLNLFPLASPSRSALARSLSLSLACAPGYLFAAEHKRERESGERKEANESTFGYTFGLPVAHAPVSFAIIKPSELKSGSFPTNNNNNELLTYTIRRH